MRRTSRPETKYRLTGTKHLLVVQIFSLCCFTLILFICIKTTERLVEHESDKVANLNAVSMSGRLDSEFKSISSSIRFLLEGMIWEPDLRDTAEIRRDTLFRTRPSNLGNLTVDKLYANLDYLVRKNDLCQSASFIFAPGLIRDASDRGVAIEVTCEGLAKHNLLENSDRTSSDLLQEITLGTNSSYIIKTVNCISMDSVVLFAIHVPIWNEKADNLLGMLNVFVDSSKALVKIQNQVQNVYNTFFELTDENYNLLYCTDTKFVGKHYLEFLKDGYAEDADRYFEWIKKSADDEVKDGASFVNNFDGRRYNTYVKRLPSTGHILFSFYCSDEVHSKVRDIVRFLLIFHCIGIMIMILSSWLSLYSYKKKKDENAIIQADLSVAKKIQDSYLPKKVPDCDGMSLAFKYKEAKEVGGDLVDFHTRNGKLYFCIGDVSGKGIPASLTMAAACSYFREAVNFGEISAATIASRINDNLSHRNDMMVFCTAVIGILDINKGEMLYCNAGHTRSLLRKACGDTSFLTFEPDFPLGTFEGIAYHEHTINLEPEDMIYLYSDGVTEAKDKNGLLFGEERLRQIISSCKETAPDKVVNTVFNAVSQFARGAEQSDDITTLCIRKEK